MTASPPDGRKEASEEHDGPLAGAIPRGRGMDPRAGRHPDLRATCRSVLCQGALSSAGAGESMQTLFWTATVTASIAVGCSWKKEGA